MQWLLRRCTPLLQRPNGNKANMVFKTGIMMQHGSNEGFDSEILSMVNGQWFIVSYDSANKQKHHKSHRMQ